jgi:L-ascorbate metabolism protein UlaG (beta-lactamase superfamily)
VPRRNNYHQGEVSDHFDGLRFHAPNAGTDKTKVELIRMLLGRGRQTWPAAPHVLVPDKPPARVADLRVSSAGHSSILLQVAGLNILIDPVWSERVSPFRFAGPKRAHEPAIAFDNLPKIDAVLITHNHYDHLDGPTLARLWQRFRPRMITPLGNQSIIRRYDPTIEVEAHDWGDRVALSESMAVNLEPALHWSGRGVRDRRMALWCSFVVTSEVGTIYHVGDTGYGDGRIFRDVGEKYGKPRLALIPIGAYEPRWFMAAQHVNPDEAVQIMIDCGAEAALGHHWGTFQLTYEAVDAPGIALAEALAARDIPTERFQPLKPGVPVEFGT